MDIFQAENKNLMRMINTRKEYDIHTKHVIVIILLLEIEY